MRQITISGLTFSAVQSRLKIIITLGVVPEVGFENQRQVWWQMT